ncbi:MAG TPA: HD domain-containing protein [Patescibacteria group bacterium]|nr:HD domain-containing protein [Patescibacteria group bacterium]
MDIVETAREYCLDVIKQNDDIYTLIRHIPEAEKWAIKIVEKHPEADKEVVLLVVWLHDVSHYVGDRSTDHAVRSEKMVEEFLEKNNYDSEKMKQVLHGVRSHRNRDVVPESIEAKIFACADSASHMTDILYLDMIQQGKFEAVLAKLERDYRDIGVFPEIHKMLTPLYETWKKFITEFQKLDMVEPTKQYL